jgi:biotin operon repressor
MHGKRQEARILATLAIEPQTCKQLVESLHLAHANVTKYIARLKLEPARIHISGYHQTTSRAAAVYSAGPGKDKPFVRKSDQRRQSGFETKLAAAYALLAKPMTGQMLQGKLFRSKSAVQNYVRSLRDDKLIHISGWKMVDGQVPIPLYSQGDKPDAPRPRKPKRCQWQKELANPDVHAYRKAKKRARYAIEKARSKPQNIFSALGL